MTPPLPVLRTLRFAAFLFPFLAPLNAAPQKKDAAPAENAREVVTFTGNKSYTAEELREAIAGQLRDVSASGLTPARADDSAYYVGTFYRKAGYSKVTVDYKIRGNQLLLTIDEGPRALLKDVTFIGNKSIPDATLYEYMIGGTEENLAKKPDDFPYTTSEVAAGADRVRGLYLSEGYLNVTIDSSGAAFSDGGKRVDVTLRITEGTRYTFGTIRFEGRTLYSREELVKALGEPVDGAFSPGTATAMQRNLQSFYKGRGYYQAQVELSADPATATGGKVPVTFTAHPKGLFRFDGVTVRNETERPRLRADFLPKRFAHLKGQVYSPEKLDETFREMLQTGLFENLRVTPVPIPGDELRLEITATEAKAKELGFTLGYGTYDGFTVGIRLGDRNLFGRGRPLTFAADYSQRGLRGELVYLNPWVFDTRFSLRSRLYSEAIEEIGYTNNEVGLRLDLTRKVLPHLELGVFVEAAKVKVTNASIPEEDLGPTDYDLAAFGFTQSTDYRNDPINPGRGFIFTSALDFAAINGEPAFSRSALRFSYYLPLGKLLLAFGARGGYIAKVVDQIPINQRYFNGGANSVRSFAERELGPKDRGGNPLGGELYTVFNTELTFPLVGALQGAVFVDAGSLYNDNVPGSGDLRYAIGTGLRYKLPIGPLRLDYGVNPDPRAQEDFGAFHFSFGFAF